MVEARTKPGGWGYEIAGDFIVNPNFEPPEY